MDVKHDVVPNKAVWFLWTLSTMFTYLLTYCAVKISWACGFTETETAASLSGSICVRWLRLVERELL